MHKFLFSEIKMNKKNAHNVVHYKRENMVKEGANNAIDAVIVTIFLKIPKDIAIRLIKSSGLNIAIRSRHTIL